MLLVLVIEVVEMDELLVYGTALTFVHRAKTAKKAVMT